MRRILPLLLAFATLGSATATWAAAGFVGTLSCCCPDARLCKCPHGRKARHASEMKSCGRGAVQLVTPAVAAAVCADEPIAGPAPAVRPVVAPAPMVLRSRLVPVPEPPPF